MSALSSEANLFPPERRRSAIAIFHMPVQIIKRSKAKSAVGAAAYRSGTKMTNEWDGLTHDYTRKRGVVHSEIILPPHAPPEFQDRSTLWNSVEMVEKTSDAQLAREIEISLLVELNREEQLRLARSFISDTFVAAGMCADFSIHDKKDGNPHFHVMLTIRPLKGMDSGERNAGRSMNWTKTTRESPTAKAAGRATGRTPPTGTTREM